MGNQKRRIRPKSIPPKVLSELKRQLNQELNAAHGYLAMSIWCALENLKGFARFFATQADEERKHAGKIIDHLVDRGVPPELETLPAPKQDYPALLDLVLQAQAMEQSNTQGIDAVYSAALADKDYPAQVLMHWFINEQVEEEAWAAELAARVKGATCAGSLSDLDRHVEKFLASDGQKED
jgi:ferritin